MTVHADVDGDRLVDVCRAHLGSIARRAIGPLITEGAITVDARTGWIAMPVEAGQRLAVSTSALQRLDAQRLTTPPSGGPLAIVHADDDLLVVDKPHGLHVHPMGDHRQDTLLGRVLWHEGSRPPSPWTACAPSPAHRLDRPTGGLVIFARTATSRRFLQASLEQHQIARTYRAYVHGVPTAASGVIDLPLGPDPDDRQRRRVGGSGAGVQQAVTRWRKLMVQGDTAVLEVTIETGRTHQIRAHLAHLGHPVVGDAAYGAAAVGPPVDPRVGGRIELRAVRLDLPHPRTGQPLTIGLMS